MAEFSANAAQIVNPGETVIFTETAQSCNRGLVRHRDGTGTFLLSGWLPRRCGCCCNRNKEANYEGSFGANISVPTGGTAGEISLAITVDGATVPASTMIETPTVVDTYSSVSKDIGVDIWNGCCESVAVRNTSDQPVQVQNANIKIDRSDLAITY